MDELQSQGWSYAEAEDILDHDETWHDDEAVPGCPRCDTLMDDDMLGCIHETDHSLCDRDDHLATQESGEDCPFRGCLFCGVIA